MIEGGRTALPFSLCRNAAGERRSCPSACSASGKGVPRSDAGYFLLVEKVTKAPPRGKPLGYPHLRGLGIDLFTLFCGTWLLRRRIVCPAAATVFGSVREYLCSGVPCVDAKNLQAIAIQGIPPIKAECKELLRRSGRAGQKYPALGRGIPLTGSTEFPRLDFLPISVYTFPPWRDIIKLTMCFFRAAQPSPMKINYYLDDT